MEDLSKMTFDMNHTYYDSIPKHKSDLMEVVGGSGRWQWQISLHMFCVLTLLALHTLSMTFLFPNQDHWCARPPEAANLSVQVWKRISIPPHHQHCTRYQANISLLEDKYTNRSYIKIIPCFSWEYDNTVYSSSLLKQWNLVCKKRWLVSAGKSSFMLGILSSAILFGHLADKYGRKWTTVASSIISGFFSVVCPFSTNFLVFIALRFFLAVGLGGYYSTAFILLMEAVVPEKRASYAMSVQTGWCFGFVLLPAVVWFIRDSFWVQISLSVPTIFLMLFSGFIPESPRWLLSKGEIEKARKVLFQAAETNDNSGPGTALAIDKAVAEMKDNENSEDTLKGLLDLLRMQDFKRIALFLFAIWFINSFIYFGLSFNTNELWGNPFINFAVSGAVEFPACFFSAFIVRTLGTRRPLAGCMILGAVVCLVLYLIPIDIPQTIVAAAMIAKFAITCSFGILYVFTIEQFPATVRNIGLRGSTACEGFGSILAPFIREFAHATHPAMPQLLFGILSLAGGALVVFLPDSYNHNDEDAVESDVLTARPKEENNETWENNSAVITNYRE